MKQFRYSTSGQWFKGNTHLHSTASDGGKTFPELAELYKADGYDFLFRTDHWVASDVAADTADYPLLWMDGIELDGTDESGSYFHVVCLGSLEGLSRDDGFDAALRSARAQGALLIAAHPHWCGNSLDDCLRWPFDGVEIYNHVCHWLNGKSNGLVHWDAVLRNNPNALAFAVDDAHLRPEHPGWNGGWIVVNADACAPSEITSAIQRGNFYSSCGPQMHAITLDGDDLRITTSPIRFARLVGPGPNGVRIGSFDGPLLTEVDMRVPADWPYVYVEIEDDNGRRAWTNNLFIDPDIATSGAGDAQSPAR
ncbi:MAG: hypothetical protein HN341_19890 [Verrucomicrobia bacterium]|jgi:hypothetical protein|nr:hypothetical protein [Verrucomicrobiota bacterium]